MRLKGPRMQPGEADETLEAIRSGEVDAVVFYRAPEERRYLVVQFRFFRKTWREP
jgi:hypothetical protein